MELEYAKALGAMLSPMATIFASLVAAGVAWTIGSRQAAIAEGNRLLTESNLLLSKSNTAIAATQAATAERQERNARMKLRLDLFERRISYYQKVVEVFEKMMLRESGVDFEGYTKAAGEGQFLFSLEVKERVDAILKDALLYPDDETENRGDFLLKGHRQLDEAFAPYFDFRDLVKE